VSSGAWSPPSAPAASLAAPLPPSALRTGQRPRIEPGESIGEYTDEELVSIVTWVASDGLLRVDSELHTEVRDEMGYHAVARSSSSASTGRSTSSVAARNDRTPERGRVSAQVPDSTTKLTTVVALPPR